MNVLNLYYLVSCNIVAVQPVVALVGLIASASSSSDRIVWIDVSIGKVLGLIGVICVSFVISGIAKINVTGLIFGICMSVWTSGTGRI